MIYDNKYIKIIKATFFLVGVKGLHRPERKMRQKYNYIIKTT